MSFNFLITFSRCLFIFYVYRLTYNNSFNLQIWYTQCIELMEDIMDWTTIFSSAVGTMGGTLITVCITLKIYHSERKDID